jgi:hypothetical protein
MLAGKDWKDFKSCFLVLVRYKRCKKISFMKVDHINPFLINFNLIFINRKNTHLMTEIIVAAICRTQYWIQNVPHDMHATWTQGNFWNRLILPQICWRVVLLHVPDVLDVPHVPPPKCDFLINLDPYRTFSRFIKSWHNGVGTCFRFD